MVYPEFGRVIAITEDLIVQAVVGVANQCGLSIGQHQNRNQIGVSQRV